MRITAALGGAAVAQNTPEQIEASETFSTPSYALARRRRSQGRSAASATDRPIEAVAIRYARNGSSDMPFQGQPPGDQRELQRFLDKGEASARHIDGLAIDAIDADAGDRLDKCFPDLSLELGSDLPNFPLPENLQDVLAEEDILAVVLHQALLDQPLLPAHQGLAHVPAEAMAGAFLVHLAGELTVEPGRALGADLSLDRHGGQRVNADGMRLCEALLVVPDPLQVIGRYRPGSVPVSFDGAGRAPDRLQAADMRRREGVARGGIMLEMDVDAVPALIGGGDLGDGPVHLARLGRAVGQADDAADRKVPLRLADVGVMAATVDAVDHQIAQVALLVGEPARDHAPDDGNRRRGRGSCRAPATAPASPRSSPVHRLDDVAALAHPSQHVFRIGRQ